MSVIKNIKKGGALSGDLSVLNKIRTKNSLISRKRSEALIARPKTGNGSRVSLGILDNTSEDPTIKEIHRRLFDDQQMISQISNSLTRIGDKKSTEVDDNEGSIAVGGS